jgi:hypothetical protein
VKTTKNILIVIEDTRETAEMAAGIADALTGERVSVRNVSDFAGNDILPADAFFLGCEKPGPASFTYITDLFKHINLANRPCGVFSPGTKEAAGYLANLVQDSEAALKSEPFYADSGTGIKEWAKSVIAE